LLTFWQSRFADNSVSLIQNKDMGQQPFITLVDQILYAKQNPPSPPFSKGGNKEADTSTLERQIDKMVYELYDLTPEEIEIVDGKQ
jgi:adenine-specific DNA-methyltransferase